jgi:Fe-S oxidoreductase
MEHNRENALCCGGLTNVNRPEISEPLRRAPLEEAKATGADILATICVGCQESFAPLEDQYPFEVRSYISLVAEAVGVQHEDRFKPLVKAGDASQVLARVRDYINTSDYSLEELERVLPQYLNRFCPKHGRLSL